MEYEIRCPLSAQAVYFMSFCLCPSFSILTLSPPFILYSSLSLPDFLDLGLYLIPTHDSQSPRFCSNFCSPIISAPISFNLTCLLFVSSQFPELALLTHQIRCWSSCQPLPLPPQAAAHQPNHFCSSYAYHASASSYLSD